MSSPRATLKNRARIINRLRWVRKYRNVAAREGNATAWQALAYILTDPELDTYSYDLANSDDLAASLAQFWGRDRADVHALFDEARLDPVLARRIAAASRWNPAVKARPKIGRHLVSYAVVRLSRPQTVLEIGVRFGLGSLVLLRALERNRHDGHPAGELVSVDIDPYAGVLVADGTPGWRFVAGGSPDVLVDALDGRRVGMLIADSIPMPWATTAEVRVALERAEQPLVVMQSGWNMVLPDLCDASGEPWLRLVEQPVAHIGAGRQCFLANFDAVEDTERALAVARRYPRGMRG